MQKDVELLANKETHPQVIVATPGRLNALVREKKLRLNSVKVFVLDECDKMLDQIGNSSPNLETYTIAEQSNQICVVMSKISSAPHLPRNKL